MVEILESKIVRNAFDKIDTVPATISKVICTFQQRILKESLVKWRQGHRLLMLSSKIRRNF